MNGPVEQALESRHGLTPHIESDDHGGLELDREGWLAEDDDPQGDGMVGEGLDGSWMMSEHREPRRRQAEVQSWKTGCQFEPWLQRPQWVNKDACSALVENLGEHGGQEIPGRIQPDGVRGSPVQEESVESGGLKVVKRGGINAGDLGGSASEGIRVDERAEVVLSTGEYLTLQRWAQRPHVETPQATGGVGQVVGAADIHYLKTDVVEVEDGKDLAKFHHHCGAGTGEVPEGADDGLVVLM